VLSEIFKGNLRTRGKKSIDLSGLKGKYNMMGIVGLVVGLFAGGAIVKAMGGPSAPGAIIGAIIGGLIGIAIAKKK